MSAPKITPMVDSAIATTRVFWRVKYYGATEAEANDPRPFAEVLKDRKAHDTSDTDRDLRKRAYGDFAVALRLAASILHPVPAAPGCVPDGAAGPLPTTLPPQEGGVRTAGPPRGRRCPRCDGIGTVGRGTGKLRSTGKFRTLCTECAGTGWAHVADNAR